MWPPSIAASSEHGCAPGSAALIEIQVRSPAVKHTVNMLKIRECSATAARSPKEKLLKERLKGLLAPLYVGNRGWYVSGLGS